MTKIKPPPLPHWVSNLRRLMDDQGLNPRSLSLKAGLNATAVRDMLEGRSRFPRYDTAKALADALETTPAILMSEERMGLSIKAKGLVFAQNTELLTEIITRLQEAATELDRALFPRDFAAMTTTIFQRMQQSSDKKIKQAVIVAHIHDLLDYENLRQKRKRG